MALGVLSVIEEDDDLPKPVKIEPLAEEDEGDEAATLPEGLSAEGDGYVLTLRRPVVLTFRSTSGAEREERFDRLPLRRLTGGDMRAMMNSQRADGSLMLLERAVTLPERRVVVVLDKMDAADLMRAMGCIAFLSGSSLPTGR